MASRAAGPGARIDWEVNDCGEQPGDPGVDRVRDVPLCVAADATLADGRAVSIYIAAGSAKRGISGPLAVYLIAIAERNTPPVFFRSLSEFAARIRPARLW